MPGGGDSDTWQEVLASDPLYPENVYLTRFVEWGPGVDGASGRGTEYTDSEGRPVESLTGNALGPPEGGGSATGGEGLTCPVGINGWAVWEFDPDWVIIDGPGDDFITFTKTWAWGGLVDGLCSELAHVQVSEDGSLWYEHGSEVYVVNPTPGVANGAYTYAGVFRLHGNQPTWANFRRDVAAEEIADPGDGNFEWTVIDGTTISRYFQPGDPHLGGVRFNLSDFHLVGNPATPWPDGGRMRYLKIIDDDTILDGQDYAPDWSLGANLMAAMGLNVSAR